MILTIKIPAHTHQANVRTLGNTTSLLSLSISLSLSFSLSLSHTHTNTNMHTHWHAQIYTPTHTYTFTYTQTHTHTHVHTRYTHYILFIISCLVFVIICAQLNGINSCSIHS